MRVSFLRALVIAAAISLMAVACGTFDPRATAVATVEAYLRDLSGDHPDRGWQYLPDQFQAEMFGDNLDMYKAAASANDWSAFSWRVREVVADDSSLYFVVLEVSSVPPLLVDRRGSWAIASRRGPALQIAVRPSPLASQLAPFGG